MKKSSLILVLILMLFLTSCDNLVGPSNAPVFSGLSELSFEVFSTPIDFTKELTLTDIEDGNVEIIESMIDSTSVEFDEVGVYIVMYTYTDSDSLTATFELTVNILDTRSPVIALSGDADLEMLIGGELPNLDFLFNDNYDDTHTSIILSGEYNTGEAGIYEILLSVTDSSGNVSNEITYTIYVLADIDLGYNIGDEVHFSGYYSTIPEGSTLKAETGFFKVQDIKMSKEYPIGLSTLTSDEIVIWAKDEFIINRNEFEAKTFVDLNVPLLHQFDYSGYLTGSSLTISGYGCAITALTMVINYMNQTDLTPEDTNPDLVSGGLVYWVNTITPKYSNISPNYFPSYTEYRTQISFGDNEAYSLFQMQVKDKLDEGIPVLVKIRGNTTHYVVAKGYGYDVYGQMYIMINDPGSSYRFYMSDLFASYQYFYAGFIYYTAE